MRIAALAEMTTNVCDKKMLLEIESKNQHRIRQFALPRRWFRCGVASCARAIIVAPSPRFRTDWPPCRELTNDKSHMIGCLEVKQVIEWDGKRLELTLYKQTDRGTQGENSDTR